MTAGQRNCFLAIQECLDRYGLDDVVFALREHQRVHVGKDDQDATDAKFLTDNGFMWAGDELRIELPRTHSPSRSFLVCSDPPNLPDCPWDIWTEFEDGTREGTMIAEELPTRGRVLMLLSALGRGESGR